MSDLFKPLLVRQHRKLLRKESTRVRGRTEWITLVGCVVSLLGILGMARCSDIREKDMVDRIKEIETKNAALRIENDVCWKDLKEKLKEVVRFRCPDKLP